ncbi:MAG: glycosyltransferase family 2 protein [Ignavibacteriales bacterium]|nr:glycosyltransferase family 2 protein [Ignavibacteriales bacterium]
MKPLITVIIPVYNTKLYLKEAIDSVLNQKEFIHEIIIVNDGSTDSSGELLDSLYSSFDFIKILHSQNQGQGPARNLGTNSATGDFIYYFDSDDISVSGLFNKFSELIIKNPELELFCFSAEPFLDANSSIENISSPVELSKEVFNRKMNSNCNSGEEAFRLLYQKKSFSPVPYLYIFKKSILAKNNIKFRAIRYEDEEFTQKLFLFAGKTIISEEVFCKRRVHSTSVMQVSRSYKDLEGYFKTIETMQELVGLNFLENETKKLLHKRINDFVRIIIIIKATNKIEISKEQKRNYTQKIKPFIKTNRKLFLLFYTYKIEYNLRKLKEQLFS